MINDEQWQGRIFPENSWIREFVNRSFLDPRREDQKYFAILRWKGWDDILCFYYWRKASVDGFAFVTSSRCLETWKQETKTQRDTFSWHSLWATNVVWILTLREFFLILLIHAHMSALTLTHTQTHTHTHTHRHTHTHTHMKAGNKNSTGHFLQTTNIISILTPRNFRFYWSMKIMMVRPCMLAHLESKECFAFRKYIMVSWDF